MSIFAKVTGEINAAERERVHSEATRAHSQQQALEKFRIDFLNAWTSIAKPAFEAFVTDAKAHGYDAKVIEHGLNTSKFGATLFLMPIVGKALSNNTQTYLRLSGEPFDQSVELVTAFDPPNAPAYSLESISQVRLETALEEFLRSALQSVPLAEQSSPIPTVVSLRDVIPPFNVKSLAVLDET